eukprot:7252074-Prymnesium_polylepis.1
MAPFVPLLEPALTKCADHSSPMVREKAALAKQKLLDGAGDLVEPAKRPRAVAALLSKQVQPSTPQPATRVPKPKPKPSPNFSPHPHHPHHPHPHPHPLS